VLGALAFRRRADERAQGVACRIPDVAGHLIGVVDARAEGRIASDLTSGRDQPLVAESVVADEAVIGSGMGGRETGDDTRIVDAARPGAEAGVDLEPTQEG